MEDWRRRVNEALDELLAAQRDESSIRKQLEAAGDGSLCNGVADLSRRYREMTELAQAAKLRVEAVLWE